MTGDVHEAHEEFLDDLPSLLSGELSPGREREVADHLDSCDPCRRELAVVARASALLRDAARLDMLAPAASADELPPLQLPRSVSRARRAMEAHSDGGRLGSAAHRTRLLATAAALVLVAAGIAGGIVVGRASDSPQGRSKLAAALHPVAGGVPVNGAVGEARLSASGGMNLSVRGLPRPPGTDFYEVWLFDPPTQRMLAVGVLPPDGKGNYPLPKETEQGYSAVEISLEPNDGDPGHSQYSVLRGPLS